jgi:hypothetical protein
VPPGDRTRATELNTRFGSGTIRIRQRTVTGALRFTGRFRTRLGCRVPAEVSQTARATFAVT